MKVHVDIISASLKPVNSVTRIPLLSKELNNRPMRIEEIYRARLKMLAIEAGSQTALATRLEKSPAQIVYSCLDKNDPRYSDPAPTR